MNLPDRALKMADVYAMNPKLEVIFLGGSVSRGWEDRYSDIELFLIWREAPTDEERLTPIQKVEGKLLAFHPYEDQEWSESFLVEETKFEISSFLMTTVEDHILSIQDGDPSLEKQCLIGALGDGVVCKGKERFEAYIDSISLYPQPLKENLIVNAFEFGGGWQNREALVHREDTLFLHATLVEVTKKLTLSLFAINEMYIHHPKIKWLGKTIDRMEVKPDYFPERIHQLLTTAKLDESIKKLEELINEVGQLVKVYCPDIDITEQLMEARSVRPERKQD